jgi:hypothetical protein
VSRIEFDILTDESFIVDIVPTGEDKIRRDEYTCPFS